MHLHPKRGTLGMAHKTVLQMVAFSHSDWDIALIPELDLGEIDIYALRNSVPSLEKHISKGYQYFGAAHIHNMRVQNIFIFTCALKPETSVSRPPVIVWQCDITVHRNW